MWVTSKSGWFNCGEEKLSCPNFLWGLWTSSWRLSMPEELLLLHQRQRLVVLCKTKSSFKVFPWFVMFLFSKKAANSINKEVMLHTHTHRVNNWCQQRCQEMVVPKVEFEVIQEQSKRRFVPADFWSFVGRWQSWCWSHYPSCYNHGSVENGCISNNSARLFRIIFHWTMIMGERVQFS